LFLDTFKINSTTHVTYIIQEETISIDTIPTNITLVDSIEEIPQPQLDAQGMALTQN
jgi:hypothetical protein